MEDKYICNSFVTRHRIARLGYSSTLQEVANHDYKGRNYFASIPEVDCLDLDTFEKAFHHDSDTTCDAAIGICQYRDGREAHCEIQLVEFKMDVENPANQEYSRLCRKDSHSRELIADDGFPVAHACYLVFADGVASRAQSYITKRSREDRTRKMWVVTGISEFQTEKIRFYRHDDAAFQSYLTSLQTSLLGYVENGNWEKFFNEIYERMEDSKQYLFTRYNLQKYYSIVQCLSKVIDASDYINQNIDSPNLDLYQFIDEEVKSACSTQ